MKTIGFNFTKIIAEKNKDFKEGKLINNSMEFTNLEREKIDILKEFEAVKLSFRYALTYTESEAVKDHKEGEIIFEGNIILSLDKDEGKDIFKSWKKKEIPPNIKILLFNFILRKCTSRALSIEEELNLPPHINIPQLSAKPQPQQ